MFIVYFWKKRKEMYCHINMLYFWGQCWVTYLYTFVEKSQNFSIQQGAKVKLYREIKRMAIQHRRNIKVTFFATEKKKHIRLVLLQGEIGCVKSFLASIFIRKFETLEIRIGSKIPTGKWRSIWYLGLTSDLCEGNYPVYDSCAAQRAFRTGKCTRLAHWRKGITLVNINDKDFKHMNAIP